MVLLSVKTLAWIFFLNCDARCWLIQGGKTFETMWWGIIIMSHGFLVFTLYHMLFKYTRKFQGGFYVVVQGLRSHLHKNPKNEARPTMPHHRTFLYSFQECAHLKAITLHLTRTIRDPSLHMKQEIGAEWQGFGSCVENVPWTSNLMY